MTHREMFFPSDIAVAVTSDTIANVLLLHGVLVDLHPSELGNHLKFRDAPGTFAEIATDAFGVATFVTLNIGCLRDIDDFRRIQAGFREIGWQYCDPTIYEVA